MADSPYGPGGIPLVRQWNGLVRAPSASIDEEPVPVTIDNRWDSPGRLKPMPAIIINATFLEKFAPDSGNTKDSGK